ncbi:MAG: hypothetical protein ACKKL5_00755 [Candidatus Komeilibacteria bacterium]
MSSHRNDYIRIKPLSKDFPEILITLFYQKIKRRRDNTVYHLSKANTNLDVIAILRHMHGHLRIFYNVSQELQIDWHEEYTCQKIINLFRSFYSEIQSNLQQEYIPCEWIDIANDPVKFYFVKALLLTFIDALNGADAVNSLVQRWSEAIKKRDMLAASFAQTSIHKALRLHRLTGLRQDVKNMLNFLYDGMTDQEYAYLLTECIDPAMLSHPQDISTEQILCGLGKMYEAGFDICDD